MQQGQDRVFAGIRATGRQHIGNYLGAIQNFVALQDRYECIYSIVDLHSLTTLTDTDQLRENVRETAIDLLAAGIRPEETILYAQSHVPEISELHLLLSMVTPIGRLMNVPTFKEKAKSQPENVNYGLVGYPVLQTADIVLYRANKVPVGEDQLPHLELAREIVRRFNNIFGDTFPEPEAELTSAPMVLGFDNRKMSKSYGNAVDMAATPEETFQAIRTAITDPQRVRRDDPGRPEVCNVYSLAWILRSGETAADRLRLPQRRDRLRRLQEDADRVGQRLLRPHPRAPRGTVGQSGGGGRDPDRRSPSRPRHRGGSAGRRQRGDRPARLAA